MDIFGKIKQLNLPLGQYAVIGSAALEARRIRKANDIDIMVSPPVFEDLLNNDWSLEIRNDGEKILRKNGFEAYLNHYCGNKFQPDPVKETIANSEIINGTSFVSLTELMNWKLAKGREKDLADVELIDKYLKNK